MPQIFCNLCACFVSCSVRETAKAKYLVSSVMVLHTLATPRLWVKVEGHNQSSTKQTQRMVEAYIWNSKILLYGTRAAAKSGHNVISRITGAARHIHCFQPSEHLFEIGTKCSKQKKETKNLRFSVLYFYWPRNIGGIVSIFSNRGLGWVKIPKYWFASEDQK